MGIDIFGKNTEELKRKRLFLFDMDGTIYKEDELFDGTLDLLKKIRQMGGRYVFITNNSSRSVSDYLERLHRMNIEADIDNFFTSTQASILYLREHHPGELVYSQGTKSFLEEIRSAGIQVVETVEDEVQVVLVGFDTELTSAKIRNTCEMLRRDVVYLATNPDLACPVSFGFIPDCGSICEMLKHATGKKPVYMGKPNSLMVEFVAKKFGYAKDKICMVGDRLYTDVATGLNAGVTAIAVLTGETTVDEIMAGDIQPTYTFESVKEIWRVLL